METITLKQLRYFDALAKTRHFSRAADLCAISQPALSMQIKDLEVRLPLPLLETATKPLQLTPYGDAFAKHAGMILQYVQELGDLANASHTAPQGLLRLGVIPTIAPYLFPRLIQSMTEAFPKLVKAARNDYIEFDRRYFRRAIRCRHSGFARIGTPAKRSAPF